MSNGIHEEIVEELNSNDPITIAGALISIGKMGLDEFRDIVLSYINHENPDIRTQALRVMTFYWKEPKFKEAAFRAIAADPDPDCREHALSYWATYFKATADKSALRILANYAQDTTQPIHFRATALHQFFRVRYPWVYSGEYSEDLGESLYSAPNEAEFEKLVPMNEIKTYL
ncbi:MAG: hypothetical protein RLZZ519_1797 [Bacteroidota bacterium]|jgi:hypothetical protein